MNWRDVEIKTVYQSIDEAKENLLDIKRVTVTGNSFSNKLAGNIDDQGNFKVVTTQKNMAMISYDGYFEKRGSDLWMVGQIRPRVLYEMKIALMFLAVALFVAYFVSGQGHEALDFERFKAMTVYMVGLSIALLAYNLLITQVFYKILVNKVLRRAGKP